MESETAPATVRFAVGSPDGPRSSTWRVWTSKTKNDWYAAVRVLAGRQKWSFHRSGVWRHAFLTEEDAKPYLDEDRVMDRWERPAEFTPGWTRALQIRVPVAGLRVGVDDGKGKPVKFVDPADAGVVCLELLQGEQDSHLDQLPSPSELLDFLQLPEGGFVVVAAHLEYPPPSDEPPTNIDLQLRPGIDPPVITPTTRVALHGYSETGERLVTETAVVPPVD
ncbi:hypothetical protein [Jongsikchunia kroppenstedtii]|uniref:hypothetical protein n=1 Tax=Jongsikchunia kroppenstedtii TaxID=1121721 RepID=UPI0012DE38C3|nr:hypothetical protein [Jongsikchunia kroppenstedtii]